MINVKVYILGKIIQSKYLFFMDGRELQCIEVEKDLGVLVDNDREFDFEQHLNETQKSR